MDNKLKEAQELADQLVGIHDELWEYLNVLFLTLPINYRKAARRRMIEFEESSFNAKYHLKGMENIIGLYEKKNE
jgi:hypothetical protein